MTRFARLLACLALLLLVAPAAAQEAPRLKVDLSATEAIPGQAVSLRLTVLVPSFMPKPPVWPTFEAPNLWVRVASTGPTSETVGGETWSGVTRRYLLSPMVPGTIALAPSQILVTYAGATPADVRNAALTTDPVSLVGVVPAGAEDLDPFIAAEELTLKETVEGTPDAMRPGDSVVRTVTAQIRGTSPMFLPRLLPPTDIRGVRTYPDEPVLAESSDRGKISGTRTERVTLLAEGGGEGEAPAVSIRWYDLGRKAVATAEAEGFAVHVDGPPVADDEPVDWRAMALIAAAAAVLAAIVAFAVRRIVPPVRRAAAARIAAWRASEGHAYDALVRTVRARDHAALRPALDLWAERTAAGDPRHDPDVAAALAALGAARYSDEAGAASGEGEGWQRLAAALAGARRTTNSRHRDAVLPPLNPGAP
ncbi:hypothetical protein [Acuticoccus sediminis]|uniref:hypothetical protein n=1 Tax=Acuticoccus sediminis TaxID=2184697 RepID=UPI001CFC9D64|nr:hypothetical protein [Acuticoccus sediminis]